MRRFILLSLLFLLLFSESVGVANMVASPNIKKSVTNNQTNITKNQYEELNCLALNVYFEAAVESTAGKLAVALVTINRVKSDRFPNTICEVVYESKRDFKNNPIHCQFSWYCDRKTDIPYNGIQWKETQKLVKWFYINQNKIPDITDGSTHYHTNYIKRPYWAKIFAKTVTIDKHIFYKE